MDGPLLELARRGRGLVLARDCAGAGISRATLRWAARSGALVPVARGAWVERDRWSGADTRSRHLFVVRAALARCPGSVVAGASAGVVWNLPMPAVPVRPVLLRPRSAGRPERGARSTEATLRRAWLDQDEVTRRSGLPVTTPARTFVDLARPLTLPWALAVADAARRTTGCSRAELVEAVDRHPCAAGHARSRRVALLADGLVESPLESLSRGVQVELGLPVPQVQVWLGRDRPEYRADMLVREYATVVEADGRLKYEGVTARPGQVWEDKRRIDRFLDLGYDCHRFVWADVHRPFAWGRDLVATFHRSARRLGHPAPALTLPWL